MEADGFIVTSSPVQVDFKQALGLRHDYCLLFIAYLLRTI